MTSVNFNASANSALRVLQQTNSDLNTTQSRIATGLKIGSAKDNAAYWSISTTMKSDNKALGTVKDALGLGAGTVDTAYQGLDTARTVLDDMKTKLTSALNPNVDREAVQKDIDAYLSSLKSIATSSVFSGENWLSVNSGVSGYSSSKQIVSSYSRDAVGTVTIDTINVDTSKIALFDANANGTGIISSQAKLSAAGVDLTFGGNAATGAAPGLQGLDTATAVTGLATGGVASAKVSVGTFSAVGLDATDTLKFDMAVDNGATQRVVVNLSTVTNRASFETALNNAVDAAFGANRVTAAIDASTNEITFTSDRAGASSAISFSNLAAVDGNGEITDGLGLTARSAFGTAQPASMKFTFSGTSDAGDKINFKFQLGADTYQTADITLTAGISKADYITALQTAVNNAVKINGGGALTAGKITVAADGANDIKFTTTAMVDGLQLAIPANGVVTTDSNGNGTTGAAADLGMSTMASTTGIGTAATTNFTYSNTNYKAGDRVSLNLTLYTPDPSTGLPIADNRTILVNAASTAVGFKDNLQTALNIFGAGKLTVTENGAGVITITTAAKGTGAGITIATPTGVDGDASSTSLLGLVNASKVDNGRDALSTALAASVRAGATFTGPATFDSGDSMTFNLAVDNAATPTKVTIDKALINLATGRTDGTINDANEFATVVNRALTVANLNTTLTATNDGGALKISKITAGPGTIAITGATSSTGASTISVNEINITSATFKALTKDQQTQLINAYINVVSDKLIATTAAAASMGSVSSRIESQKTFVNTLMSTIDKGISGLVDADMNEESTKLQALQVKQQLGVQALSIANQSAQSVLSLFRG